MQAAFTAARQTARIDHAHLTPVDVEFDNNDGQEGQIWPAC